MIDAIKKLREKTGAGMMDCKEALKEAGGDAKKALDILRKKGLSLAQKKSSRSAKEGLIQSYIHTNGKIGVLVEVNCETDFVARNEEFKGFVKDISMQIAAANPSFVKKEDVPKEIIDKEKEIMSDLDKFYQETCLLEQPFIKDPDIKIKDLLNELIAKTKENISIRRFVRYELGEEEARI